MRDREAIGGIGFAFADHVPNSGQEHAANGDNGFLVAAVSLDAAVTDAEFGVILGFNDSVGDLDKNRLQVGTRFGDAGGLDGFIALVISGAATRPRDDILDEGNTDISTPISETTVIAVKGFLSKPGIV